MNSATDEIMALLQERIGLDKESVGRAAVEYALRVRMAALRIERVDEYRRQLDGGSDELQQLIETVIVPETWFFRHQETFDELVRFVLNEWPMRNGGEALKVLSLPCSTGEEPYSVVMSLLDAGFPLSRLQVDAIDISGRALAHAVQGLYRPYSFRSRDLLFRERYFAPEGGAWRLRADLRQAVRFRQGNALELHTIAGQGAYDIVLCRNLLIYLDTEAQARVIANLAYCLQPEGRLYSSPAEHTYYAGSGFQSLGVASASVFVRRGAAQRPRPEGLAGGRGARQPRPLASPRPKVQKPPSVGLSKATPHTASVLPSPAAAETDTLEAVATLAGAGRLQEAREMCVRQMSEKGESAEGLYLLGLISDTRHEVAEAEKLYRKALYLNPGHVEALLHLAWLCESAGDSAEARQLRARATRAQERKR